MIIGCYERTAPLEGAGRFYFIYSSISISMNRLEKGT